MNAESELHLPSVDSGGSSEQQHYKQRAEEVKRNKMAEWKQTVTFRRFTFSF